MPRTWTECRLPAPPPNGQQHLLWTDSLLIAAYAYGQLFVQAPPGDPARRTGAYAYPTEIGF